MLLLDLCAALASLTPFVGEVLAALSAAGRFRKTLDLELKLTCILLELFKELLILGNFLLRVFVDEGGFQEFRVQNVKATSEEPEVLWHLWLCGSYLILVALA